MMLINRPLEGEYIGREDDSIAKVDGLEGVYKNTLYGIAKQEEFGRCIYSDSERSATCAVARDELKTPL